MAAGPPGSLGEALWEKALPKLMIKLAIAGLLAWLVRTALAAKPREGMLGTDARVIRYGAPVAWIGGVGLAVALAMLVFASRAPEIRNLILGFGVVLGLTQAALLATALGTTIEYDGAAITKHSAWRAPVTLQWNEVVTVTFRSGAGNVRFESADGRRIDAGIFMQGIGGLLADLPRLAGEERSREALQAHARLRDRYHL